MFEGAAITPRKNTVVALLAGTGYTRNYSWQKNQNQNF
jgi:hypothetical protein